jgi:hypothetical protein
VLGLHNLHRLRKGPVFDPVYLVDQVVPVLPVLEALRSERAWNGHNERCAAAPRLVYWQTGGVLAEGTCSVLVEIESRRRGEEKNFRSSTAFYFE